MNREVSSTYTGADIWIKYPRAFIFTILRMITRSGIGKNFFNLIYFLGTTDDEIKDFFETNIPPVEWLI